MAQLPHCDDIFRDHVAPNYPEAYFQDAVFKATKPDLVKQFKPGKYAAHEVSTLDDEWKGKVRDQLARMRRSAIDDWQRICGQTFPDLPSAIAQIDQYYGLDKVSDLITTTTAREKDNEVFISCVQLGACLGALVIELNEEWSWLPSLPYWESPLYHRPTGHVANVFHWAVKKFSSYGVEDDLIGKCRMCSNLTE